MAKKTGGGEGRGSRGLRVEKVRVKTARGRRSSSTRWLQRQLNDPYVQRAKQEGFRSRSTFKLIEMDDRFQFLKPGMRVVDLGCAPGGWCDIAARRVNSSSDNPLVVGIDYLGMDPLPGVTVLLKDFLDDDAPDVLMEALGGHPPDIVLSDMAAPTTGHKQTDHLRTVHLFEVAAQFAKENLRPGGVFLSKVFKGGTENDMLAELKRDYQTVSHIKPPASRKESPEMYVFAKGFRGRPQEE
nr:RlmE family RNA methyltransferase [uncultured Cohaesibacter sp.]